MHQAVWWRCDCNTSLDCNRDPARVPLSLLTACPTTSAEGSDGGKDQPSPAAEVRAPCKCKPANATHAPALGCSRNRPPEKRTKLHVVRRVMERAGERREKAEQESSWMPFFILLFFFKWKTFYASSSKVRGAAEVLKGKREA